MPANLPSTLMMNAIPAKISQVKNIVLANPRYNGKLNAAVMYVAKKCKINSISFVQLLSPTTSITRMKKIIKDSHDMIYYISMLSTTGGKLKVSPKKILENYSTVSYTHLTLPTNREV